jgi:hypothetical protein
MRLLTVVQIVDARGMNTGDESKEIPLPPTHILSPSASIFIGLAQDPL